MLTAVTPQGNVITRDENHVYRVDGNIMPGVMQILQALNLPDWSGVPRGVLESKRILGDYVHRCIELYHAGRLDESRLRPDALGYWEAYRSWLDQRDRLVLGNEILVYSARYQYCGTPDLLLPDAIWDVKCRAEIGPEVGLQLAAYRRAYREMYGIEEDLEVWALQLRPDGTYREHSLNDPRHDPGWLNHLGAYNWRRCFNVEAG